MLIDVNELDAGEVIDTDVCIVGAGPAGITLARELADEDFRVCLLESGGTEPDERTEMLAAGETVGDCIQELHTSRARALGGTSHLWNSKIGDSQIGFRAGALAALDFEKRDWVPHSGWPFDKAHLDPFYERAQATCELGPYHYEGSAWETETAARLPLDEDSVTTSVWQFATQNIIADTFQQRVAVERNITTYLHANVVEIELSESCNTVTRLRVASLRGARFWVQAKFFVLAAGGIENARLLLISDKQHKAGIGNQNDLVGRYFMEHQVVRAGTLFPANRSMFDRVALYDQRFEGNASILGKLDFTDEVLRREELLNVSAMLLPKHRWHDRVRQDSVDSLAELLRSARRLKVPPDGFRHLSQVIGGLDYVAAALFRKASRNKLFPYFINSPDLISGGGWSKLENKDRRFSFFEVLLHTEQAPDPENRVTLSNERDELGCRRARLNWRWRDIDVESVHRAQTLLAAQFDRAGIGELRIELKDGRPNLVISGLHHHMGTTRMSSNTRQGVVDPNSRVHGLSNLFVAGCSVFPTGGYINCTLTIVALAIRLADHLKALWHLDRTIQIFDDERDDGAVGGVSDMIRS